MDNRWINILRKKERRERDKEEEGLQKRRWVGWGRGGGEGCMNLHFEGISLYTDIHLKAALHITFNCRKN